MLTASELVLVAVLAVLVMAGGVVGSRFAASADEEMRERDERRTTDAATLAPPRPAQKPKRARKRR